MNQRRRLFTLSDRFRRNLIIGAGSIIITGIWLLVFLVLQFDSRAAKRQKTIAQLSDTVTKLAKAEEHNSEFFDTVRQLILLGNTGDPAERQKLLDQLRAQEAQLAQERADAAKAATSAPVSRKSTTATTARSKKESSTPPATTTTTAAGRSPPPSSPPPTSPPPSNPPPSTPPSSTCVAADSVVSVCTTRP